MDDLVLAPASRLDLAVVFFPGVTDALLALFDQLLLLGQFQLCIRVVLSDLLSNQGLVLLFFFDLKQQQQQRERL